ncbi:hypothetical protein C8F01DRAFT_1084402 [Mycena amicta]|nr:hypothetical protein C8F01DRAFT_1084402 [Mycena amicta]
MGPSTKRARASRANGARVRSQAASDITVPAACASAADVWELDLGDELPGLDDTVTFDDKDLDSDSDIEVLEGTGVGEEATKDSEEALTRFREFLVNAQRAAVQRADAEDEKTRINVLGRTRPTKYDKTSRRTKQRHAKVIQEKKENQKTVKTFGNVFAFMMRRPAEQKGEPGTASAATDSEGARENSEAEMSSAMEVDNGNSDVAMVSDDELDEISRPPSPILPTTTTTSAATTPPADSLMTASIAEDSCMNPVNLAHVRLRGMLEAISAGVAPEVDLSPETAADRALTRLHYQDFPALRRAAAQLSLLSKDKKHDVVFRTRLVAMQGTLNIYLNPAFNYTWRQASILIAHSQGLATHQARRIRDWLHTYLATRKLPEHIIGDNNGDSLLDDEDFALAIKFHLQTVCAKNKHFRAQDIVDFVATEEIQTRLDAAGAQKRSISVRTARRWLKRMDWRFGARKNGMYIDGHEREDVVAYREVFVKRWMEEYEPRIVVYGNDGNVVQRPDGDTFKLPEKYAGQPFQLIPVTHDESTFYKNDRRKVGWIHTSSKPTPEAKGEGESIMVTDFLVAQWGRLRLDDWEARLFFRAGKNRDGYFTSDDLLAHVDNAIDIFNKKTHKFATGLFLFDNAPSHQKRAADALSARKMPKGPHATWTHTPNGPHMRPGKLADGTAQPLYWPDNHPTMPGWFKGMEQILRERGLFRDGLNAQCPGFKCKPDTSDCCCRRLMFSQPDFVAQKSALQELVESRGHICDFYPKYHCELNFIEMYWGAAKAIYRKTDKTKTIDEMEDNMRKALDAVPQLSILRYANRAARFISAYAGGLNGEELAYVQRKYKGHRMLPQFMINEVKASIDHVK